MGGGYYSSSFYSSSSTVSSNSSDGDSGADSSGGEEPVVLDLDGDGYKENVGWVGLDDALLAIDLDGDGEINQTKEVNFAHGVDEAETDLDGVRAVYDDNRDGVLDANDARFNDFRVWRDANGDGVSEPGELKTLTEAGITSIRLTGDRVDEARDDNGIARYTDYTTADGAKHQVGDATFSVSGFGYAVDEATGDLSLNIDDVEAIGFADENGSLTVADGAETQPGGAESRPRDRTRRRGGGAGRRVPPHPLTPPSDNPPTSHFCAARKTTVMGMPESTAAAAKSPHR